MSVHRSLAFAFLNKYVIVAINLVVTAVVARLLTPAEIGLFMVGSAVVSLTETFRDFGVSAYLVQEREITREGVRTAFTVTSVLSLLLAGILYAAAAPIAAYYGEPYLRQIIELATLGFILVPFSNPIMGLLRRDMAFDTIAFISVTNAVVSSIATIAFAELGYGALSFVWASLIGGAMTTVLALRCRPQFWIFRPALAEWRKVFSFGGYTSATSVLNTFFELLPRLILGRILSFDAVGLYGRAVALCQMPERSILGALQPVVLPALSARARLGGDLKEPYLRGLSYMTAVQWPALIILSLLAYPIVHVLLGEQWLATAPLVRIIALASLCLFPAFLSYPLLVSVGRVKDTLTSSLIALPPSAIVLTGAAFLGVQAVAASLFLTAPFQVYIALSFIRRHVSFTWGELAGAVRKGALVTLCTAVAPIAAIILAGFRFDLSIAAGAIAGVGAVLGWIVGLFLTSHPLLSVIRGTALAARQEIVAVCRRGIAAE
jgi:O-antigen/teichoic acid export membrane protein